MGKKRELAWGSVVMVGMRWRRGELGLGRKLELAGGSVVLVRMRWRRRWFGMGRRTEPDGIECWNRMKNREFWNSEEKGEESNNSRGRRIEWHMKGYECWK